MNWQRNLKFGYLIGFGSCIAIFAIGLSKLGQPPSILGCASIGNFLLFISIMVFILTSVIIGVLWDTFAERHIK